MGEHMKKDFDTKHLNKKSDNEHTRRKNIEIISVSIRPQQVEQMNKIMQITGMKSRSKLISHAVSKFCDDQKEISDITDDNTIVFMISHNHLHKSDATSTILGYEDLVRTILHHHSKSGCLDILIVQGEPERIKQLYKKICIMKGISSIDFSII